MPFNLSIHYEYTNVLNIEDKDLPNMKQTAQHVLS